MGDGRGRWGMGGVGWGGLRGGVGGLSHSRHRW